MTLPRTRPTSTPRPADAGPGGRWWWSPISAAAVIQRRLWGTDPQAWAELAEAHNRPLFSAVLDAARVGPGISVLDVGCGAGLTLVLAAERGAQVSGLDVSPGLLGVARRRLPGADLRDGDMESLPFPDAAFDAVVGVNAIGAGQPGVRAGEGRPAGGRRGRGQVLLALRDAGRRRPGAALLGRRRPGGGSGGRGRGPRRPWPRPGPVPVAAHGRGHPGEHVPLGGREPALAASPAR